MGIASVPAASTAAASLAFSSPLAAKLTTYEHIQNFTAGVYTVELSPGECTFSFASATAIVTEGTTISGAATIQLTSAATIVYLTGDNSVTANTIVTITRTADILSPDDIGNGTLDTITTTGAYNQTGTLGVLVFSGGQAGMFSNSVSTNDMGRMGGRAGYINGGVVITNTATTVTIGAAGVSQTVNAAAVEPTNSSFGNLVTANAASNFFVNAVQNANEAVGNASAAFQSWNTNSTTGSGGSKNYGNSNTQHAGGGSGIGTGGTTALAQSNGETGGDATGFAAGGAGGAASANATARRGGAGSPGVVYVLRGF